LQTPFDGFPTIGICVRAVGAVDPHGVDDGQDKMKTSDSSASWYLGNPLSVLRVIEGSERFQPKPNGPLPAPES
jgi:hypothetical protein